MRILFSSTWGFGHIFPMVPLARACAALGHDVRWATGAVALVCTCHDSPHPRYDHEAFGHARSLTRITLSLLRGHRGAQRPRRAEMTSASTP